MDAPQPRRHLLVELARNAMDEAGNDWLTANPILRRRYAQAADLYANPEETPMDFMEAAELLEEVARERGLPE